MKLNKIAAAVATLALVGAGTAQANSFASAELIITGIKWLDSNNNIIVNGGVGAIAAGTNKADLGITLTDSAGKTMSNTPLLLSSPFGQIPFTSRSIGPDQVADNAATPNPGPTGNVLPHGLTYSYASYELSGAIVDTGLAPPTGANAYSMAQVDLSGKVTNPSSGTSSSNVGSNASFTAFVTTPVSTITTHFVLDYVVHLLANVTAPNGTQDSAKASVSWKLNIKDAANHLNFLPLELNQDVSVNGFGIDQVNISGSLRSDDFNLDSGDAYTFTITSNVQAEGLRDVPEPDSLALFGIGFAGFVASALRRRKQA